jgi:hypothetical protein
MHNISTLTDDYHAELLQTTVYLFRIPVDTASIGVCQTSSSCDSLECDGSLQVCITMIGHSNIYKVCSDLASSFCER